MPRDMVASNAASILPLISVTSMAINEENGISEDPMFNFHSIKGKDWRTPSSQSADGWKTHKRWSIVSGSVSIFLKKVSNRPGLTLRKIRQTQGQALVRRHP